MDGTDHRLNFNPSRYDGSDEVSRMSRFRKFDQEQELSR